MRRHAYAAGLTLLAALGCANRENANSDSSEVAATSESVVDRQQNACRLLTGEEVTAVVGREIALAELSESEPGYSVCDWEDRDGMALFQLKVYWREGRKMWDIWRTAQGISETLFTKYEGVGLDSVVKQGPVPGIGDAAYFSELLPSLLLKNDVLIEITNPVGRRPAEKFRGLADKLLSRL